jgi:hypothetical protein
MRDWLLKNGYVNEEGHVLRMLPPLPDGRDANYIFKTWQEANLDDYVLRRGPGYEPGLAKTYLPRGKKFLNEKKLVCAAFKWVNYQKHGIPVRVCFSYRRW